MACETIYDHPAYYDILFGWDRSREADFYHRLFQSRGVPPGAPILEVACGTGQVARRLARHEWRVTGLDISPAMLAFLSARAAEEGVSVGTECGDMAAFASESPFAAAYNPMSSFRLLRSHAAAEAHLRCTAAALRAGGIYVLDLELAGRSGAPPPTTDEAWEMTRGGVTVRAENDSIRVRDGAVERVLAWGLEGHLRAYTAAAFARRVEAAGAFEIESWHPESRRAGDVSVFDVERMLAMPGEGRGMVVLRKREQPGASPGIVAP